MFASSTSDLKEGQSRTVSDGFDFRPPPPRREKRQFEPPPWEKEQFEELARQRAEQERAERERAEQERAEQAEAAERERAGSDAQAAAEAAHEIAAVELGGEAGEVAAEAAAPAGVSAGERSATAEPAVDAAAEPKPQVDEKRVAMMMLELKAEEPDALEGVWLINIAAGIAVTLIGLAIAVWGLFAFGNRSLGTIGVLGGFVMLMFGVGFIAAGAWLVYRAMRQRGVL
jgi:hypothetical protein